MDWATLIASALGGLIGSSFGAYYRAYWIKRGETFATYKDIQTLLAAERVKAYEQEKGKQLATNEDIDKILAQVSIITQETETIKAQIGQDLWTRQAAWQQKRECYFNLLNKSHELISVFTEVISAIYAVEQIKVAEAMDAAERRLKMLETHNKQYDVLSRLAQSMNHAEIFLDQTGLDVISHFRKNYPMTDPVHGTDDCTKKVAFLIDLNKKLIAAARQDLKENRAPASK
jgi:hypothetical protein